MTMKVLRPCGKRVDRDFGGWSYCWLVAGHSGVCVFGISS